MSNDRQLAHFPINFFPMVMGLAGMALAWRKAAQMLALEISPHMVMEGLAVLVFAVLVLTYGLKCIKCSGAVKQEFHHPVKSNFFSAISISIILISAIALPYSEPIATALFTVGAIMNIALTISVFSRWIFGDHLKNAHINPTWFIPVVGNILVPVVAVPLGFEEIGWWFFSIGIVFWLVLLTIFMHRIFFFDALPPMLVPTLFILIAPPTVGFVAYLALNGYVDNFAQVLYGVGLFLTIFLLSQYKRFAKLPFFLSWWAYSFPLSSITLASLHYFEQSQYQPARWISLILLGLMTAIILGLIVRTLGAIKKKGICQPEG
ncbi:MAG: SLAC1 anion channel family protein [Arenicellales bacterium]